MFSDKRFIVYVYALKTSCLCPYKESELSQSDTSDFRVPQFLNSVSDKNFEQNCKKKQELKTITTIRSVIL